ncbi:hypothetical protein J5I95_04980 [Candidatus Poribacteria bacterium]|nr:hypothetical protein [Candidatus Poribacteria bacterium]
MRNSMRYPYLIISLAFCILIAAVPTLSLANERLRIVGMGGTRIATSADDAGIFGNPASTFHTTHHNVALGIALEDLYWAELPKGGTEKFVAEANLDASPGLYYSHAFGGWGMSLGYVSHSTNFVNFTLEKTRAQYNRNLRQFTAKTDLITDYNLRQNQNWVIGLSRAFGKLAAGTRLKWVRQTVNRGTTISTLNLEVRHEAEVDIGVPEALVAAIVEEAQDGNREWVLDHARQPTLERTVDRLELDIGLQHEIQFGHQHSNPPLQVGVLIENFLRADLVEPFPFRLGVGIAYEPLEWATVAADLWRDIGDTGVNFAVGGELHKMWAGTVPKAAALRIGTGRVNAAQHFSIGAGFRLGTTYLEYSVEFRDFTYAVNKHLFAFTLRF